MSLRRVLAFFGLGGGEGMKSCGWRRVFRSIQSGAKHRTPKLDSQLGTELFEGEAVFDVGGIALVPVRLGTVDCVEDGGDVRLDGEAAVVAGAFQFGENLADLGLAGTGEGVLGGLGFASGRIGAVFDVDVDDVFADGVIEFEGVLPREGAVALGLGAIHLEDGVGGVEDELESGHFFDEAQGMLGRKAAPVHAVFVGGGEAGIGEASDDFAQAAEAFGFVLVVTPRLLRVGHDADDLGSEALHAGDGALDFGESDVEVAGDGLAPVPDEGAELGDGDAGFVELVGDGIELVFGEFVDVAAIDATGRNFAPANFLGGFDLGGKVAGGFVGKSGEIHG